jgi:hypothetical protein
MSSVSNVLVVTVCLTSRGNDRQAASRGSGKPPDVSSVGIGIGRAVTRREK